MTVSLDDPGWISVQGRPSGDFPRQFAEALGESARVGLVFGSQQARMALSSRCIRTRKRP